MLFTWVSRPWSFMANWDAEFGGIRGLKIPIRNKDSQAMRRHLLVTARVHIFQHLAILTYKYCHHERFKKSDSPSSFTFFNASFELLFDKSSMCFLVCEFHFGCKVPQLSDFLLVGSVLLRI